MADALGEAALSWHWTTRVVSWRPPGHYTALGRIRGVGGHSALIVTGRGDGLVVLAGTDGTVALWRLGGGGLVRIGDPQPGHGDTGRRQWRSVSSVARLWQ